MTNFYEFKEWKIRKLEEICKITSGGTPSRGNQEYFGGNIPWVKIGDLNNSTLFNTEEYLTNEGLKNSSAKIFPQNTILFAMYGATIGKTAILGVEAATNQAICGIQCSEIIHPKFLHYFLKWKCNYIRKQAEGGAQPNVNQKKVRELKIALPPMKIQLQIIKQLDNLLTNIDIKKAQMIAIWDIIDKNFLHLQYNSLGKNFTITLGFGKSNSKYPTKLMSEVCKSIVPGFADGSKKVINGTIHLRMNNIDTNFELNMNLLRTVNASDEKKIKYRLKIGDILFNNTNSSELVGKSAIFDRHEICLYSNHITRLRVIEELLIPEWVLFYLRSKWLNGDFKVMCNKWINQAAVNNSMLRNIEIPVPPIHHQINIIKDLKKISYAIKEIKKKRSELNLIRKTINLKFNDLIEQIMYLAFSGKMV